jgi:hypothetical protein
MNPNLAKKLIQLTSLFEGGSLAGNFDQQIVSWGALQWNLGQGTLQGVLRRIYQLDPVSTLKIMGSGFCASLDSDQTFENFARSQILSGGNQPTTFWRAKFAELARLEAAVQSMAEHAAPYILGAEKLATACHITTERGLALCFDVAVQNGAPRNAHIFEYLNDLEQFKIKYHDKRRWYEIAEWQRLKVLANAVANLANPKWRRDVLSRKLCIALGQGVVHGQMVNLEKDYGIGYRKA